jgi:hypothetical protein
MSRIEIFRGQARRRWSDEAKRRLKELRQALHAFKDTYNRT